MIASLVALARMWVLLRRKGYRAFPLYFLGFSLGLFLMNFGLTRFTVGDETLRHSGKGGGIGWYQEIGMGITFMLMAVSSSWAYLEARRVIKLPPDGIPVKTAEIEPETTPLPAARSAPVPRADQRRVIHTYDPALSNRVETVFRDNQLSFGRQTIDDPSGLTGIEIWVDTAQTDVATKLARDEELNYIEENATIRCQGCNQGMIETGELADSPGEERAYLEFVCRKCGAKQLHNFA
ncbi:hypothetical protein [Synoicihabitans lomoniglobus]|uniref:Uncharacterized protein n=1 Tax=Synoicihabitans lomoniglobus TaxID=2909285 RepID=A0AAF0CGH7_9BACT|nr:hypothetical protein [Opitutaceae bacterium LMO-M01]WED63632.1 hypothetical protein PXH66_14945 [Opitutaceae bacterium LMO-M01]